VGAAVIDGIKLAIYMKDRDRFAATDKRFGFSFRDFRNFAQSDQFRHTGGCRAFRPSATAKAAHPFICISLFFGLKPATISTQTCMSSTTSNLARVEPATLEDLPELVELLTQLFSLEKDFEPDKHKQEHGLRLILEQPSRGRIFVARTDHKIIGMANLLFTISTAAGGFVILMEDVIVHPDHRGHGYGSQLLGHVIDFARKKNFKRITLLTDQISAESQRFFQKAGFQYSQMIPMRLSID